MKTVTKGFSVVLFALILAFVFSACTAEAPPATPTPTPTPEATPEPTPEPVRRTLVVIEEGEVMVMTAGDEVTLTPLMRDDVENKAVTWSSSDDSVVSVDPGGKVTAVVEGMAEVTVTAVDGGATDMIVITVNSSSLLTVTNEGTTDYIMFDNDGTYKVNIMFLGALLIEYTDTYTVSGGTLELPNPGPDASTTFGDFPMFPEVTVVDDTIVITVGSRNDEGDLEVGRFVLTAEDAAKLGVGVGEADSNALVRLTAEGSTDSITFGADGTYSVDIMFMGAVPIVFEDTYEVSGGVLSLPNPGPSVATAFGDFPMWPVTVVEGDKVIITINTNNGEDLELGRFILTGADAAALGVG